MGVVHIDFIYRTRNTIVDVIELAVLVTFQVFVHIFIFVVLFFGFLHFYIKPFFAGKLGYCAFHGD